MYRKENDNLIIREIDGAHIPVDIANGDYRAYLDWVAEGNVSEPEPEPKLKSKSKSKSKT
jgi:hypothetical protein